MDLKAEEFVQRILSAEAHQEPSDSAPVGELQMTLPPWFDEDKYKQGQKFFKEYSFAMTTSILLGLTAVFSVPSILRILVAGRKGTSSLTAYRRYWATFQHILSWFEHELKPGTTSWKSLQTVRSRHFQAGRAAALKGLGTVSQRDVALSLYSLCGFSYLKPDKFGFSQSKDGDWDAINHVWRVVGYMIGLRDRYNICAGTFEETREMLQLLQDRVFTPCLDNPPEYFEHMSRAMVNGVSIFYPPAEPNSLIFLTKNLAGVPGYVYTEEERLALRHKLLKCLKGKSTDQGVMTSALMETARVEGLSAEETRCLYPSDYNTLDESPAYKKLPVKAKFKLAVADIMVSFYKTTIGRIIINNYFMCYVFLASYFPLTVIWNFGIQNAYNNMFKENPVDNEIPKLNSEYSKPLSPEPWYKVMLDILW